MTTKKLNKEQKNKIFGGGGIAQSLLLLSTVMAPLIQSFYHSIKEKYMKNTPKKPYERESYFEENKSEETINEISGDTWRLI